jgi:hypothetical protein
MNEFVKNGYVRLPFISAKRSGSQLRQKFFDTLPQSGGQITAEETGMENSRMVTYDFTFIDKNPAYKKLVFDIITKFFEPHMARLLDNYKPIIANYIRKQAATGEVPLHQNWAFADEKKCYTVSIWCPLVDSTVANGTLQVVPGSHKRFGEIRGPLVPWELENIKEQIIENHLVPLETKAGDCIILDDSIVHYSAINKTEGLRLAIQLICIPAEFSSWHYYGKGDKVDILEVDENFYMEFNPWKQPDYAKKIDELSFQPHAIDEAEFIKRLNSVPFDSVDIKPSFLQRVKIAVFGA